MLFAVYVSIDLMKRTEHNTPISRYIGLGSAFLVLGIVIACTPALMDSRSAYIQLWYQYGRGLYPWRDTLLVQVG